MSILFVPHRPSVEMEHRFRLLTRTRVGLGRRTLGTATGPVWTTRDTHRSSPSLHLPVRHRSKTVTRTDAPCPSPSLTLTPKSVGERQGVRCGIEFDGQGRRTTTNLLDGHQYKQIVSSFDSGSLHSTDRVKTCRPSYVSTRSVGPGELSSVLDVLPSPLASESVPRGMSQKRLRRYGKTRQRG